MKNKIGWCNATWNPVWGCKNKCPYCYATKINRRFWAKMIEIERDYHFKKHQSWAWTGDQLRDLHDFKPTFLEAQFNKKFPRKPQRIFVGSMSEIYYWNEEWIERVIGRAKWNPQHTFIFLTQHPEVYAQYLFTPNCWYGVTMTRNKPIERVGCIPTRKGLKFLSIEPILEKINIKYIDNFKPDWVILGAETGKRRGKVIPKREWIDNIINYCKYNDVPIYLKDNLKNIYPEKIKMFPEVKLRGIYNLVNRIGVYGLVLPGVFGAIINYKNTIKIL